MADKKTFPIYLVLLMIGLSGCASVMLSPEVREMKHAREAAFSENLHLYQARTPEEREIIALLRDQYKKGYETFNLALIKDILAPDFQLRYYATPDSVEVKTKDEFLAARVQWTPKQSRARELLINLQEFKCEPDGNKCAVATLTTHKSKYFAPRFAEVFVFERLNKQWKILRQLVVTAYPPRPELNEASIFVGDYKSGFAPFSIGPEMTTHGPDAVIDDYMDVSGFWRSDGIQRPAIVVFREPVPPTSKVIIHHGPPLGQSAPSYDDRVSNPKGTPYYYVLVSGWRVRGSACIPFSIEVDGVMIHRETICSR